VPIRKGGLKMIWERIRHDPPHNTCDWVKIDVYIRRASDGVERIYHTDGILEEDNETLATYIWEEGNFSCDCNRYLFFQRAVDEKEINDCCKCGYGGYLLWIINPVNKETVYDER
jgi:hypothetical protein